MMENNNKINSDMFQYDNNEALELEKELEKDVQDVQVTDSIKMYMNEIKQYPLLEPENEKQLLKISKSKDKQKAKIAKDRLLLCNLRLVFYVAHKYKNLGIEFEDLVSEGTFGLKTAIDKFDFKQNTKLSTYAVWWIKSYISAALANQGKMIKIPKYIQDVLLKYKKIKTKLRNDTGKEPSDKEIARKMKMTEEKLKNYLMYNISISSLSTPLDKDNEDSDTLGDVIKDTYNDTPEEAYAKSALKELIKEKIEQLNTKEAEIISVKFGIEDDVEKTFKETAEIVGLSETRVKQLTDKALKRLKYMLAELKE